MCQVGALDAQLARAAHVLDGAADLTGDLDRLAQVHPGEAIQHGGAQAPHSSFGSLGLRAISVAASVRPSAVNWRPDT